MTDISRGKASSCGHGFNINLVPAGRPTALAPVLERLARLDHTHVEIVARRLDLVVGGRPQTERVRDARRALADAGLKPTFHANHAVNLMAGEHFEAHLQAAAASIDCAAELGAGVMVMHSGRLAGWDGDAGSGALADALERERSALVELGERAQSCGVVIAVENMVARPWRDVLAYGADPAALAAQLAAIDHPAVGACLDIGHARLSAAALDTDFASGVSALLPWVRHLHIHDNCGTPDRIATGDGGDDMALGIGDMHAPLGGGTIDWPAIADLLAGCTPCTVIHELSVRFEDRLDAASGDFRSWFEGVASRWMHAP